MIVTDWSVYPDFSQSEFACSHSGLCWMDVEFMDLLQTIRHAYGRPMMINSGYRDKTHPIEAAKSEPGEHYYGRCADIGVSGSDAHRLLKLALDLGVPRVGVQQKGTGRFLHLGLGYNDAPTPWIWSYP